MKTTTLFILANFAMALNSHAATLSFGGQTFQVMAAGRSLQVIPAEVHSSLFAIPSDNGGTVITPDCDNIAGTISRREYLISGCKDNPSPAVCKALVKSLRLLAEGRPENDGTPVDRTAEQIWQISAPGAASFDALSLKREVSRKFNVAEEKVEIWDSSQSSTRPKLTGKPQLHLEASSLTSRVSALLNFEEQNLGQLQENERILTKNNLLSCDLVSGKAAYSAIGGFNLHHVEKVPEEVLDYAWKVRVALETFLNGTAPEQSPLVQAAMIGFQIAGALPAHPEAIDPLLAPPALFLRLFDLESGAPKLKVFASKQSFRADAYPDEITNLSVQQNWRIQ